MSSRGAARFLQIRRPRHGERRTGRRSDTDVQDGGPRNGASRPRPEPAGEGAMSGIDPRAIVSPSREIGNGRSQSAPSPSSATKSSWATVALSSPTRWCSGPSTIRPRQSFLSRFRVVGGDPQDLTYTGQRARLEVGDANEFREFCTVQPRHDQGRRRHAHRQPQFDHGLRAHRATIACIGNHVILTNGAQLAGHIMVEDYAGDQRVLPGAPIRAHRRATHTSARTR